MKVNDGHKRDVRHRKNLTTITDRQEQLRNKRRKTEIKKTAAGKRKVMNIVGVDKNHKQKQKNLNYQSITQTTHH